MSRLFAYAFAAFCLLGFFAPLGVSGTVYTFDGIITSSVNPGVSGVISIALDSSASLLTVSATYKGLSSTITASHLHGCLAAPYSLSQISAASTGIAVSLAAYTGASGTIAQLSTATTSTFYSSFLTQYSISTAAAAQAQLLSCLGNQQIYYNIHTLNFPSGEAQALIVGSASVLYYTTTLTPDSGVMTSGQGTASVLIHSDFHVLTFNTAWSGLTSNVTMAHIHIATAAGGTGNPAIWLINLENEVATVDPTLNGGQNPYLPSGNYFTVIDLSQEIVEQASIFYDSTFYASTCSSSGSAEACEHTLYAALVSGLAYVNFHTVNNGNGEISGFLTGGAGSVQTATTAALTGNIRLFAGTLAEYPSSAGGGYSLVAADTVNNKLQVAVFWNGLTGTLQAAHLHGCLTPPLTSAATGSAGIAVPLNLSSVSTLYPHQGVVFNTIDLNSPYSYNSLFLSANGGTASLAAQAFLTCLESNQIYTNLHTVDFPGGEMAAFNRLTSQFTSFRAIFSQSPGASVATTGSGQAWIFFDVASHYLVVYVTFSGLTSALTMAHIHACSASEGASATPAVWLSFGLSLTQSGTIFTVFQTNTAGVVNPGLNSYYDPSFIAAHNTTKAWNLAETESALFTCLSNGDAYVNLHTTNNPNGELAGIVSVDVSNFTPAPFPTTTPAPMGSGAALLTVNAITLIGAVFFALFRF